MWEALEGNELMERINVYRVAHDLDEEEKKSGRLEINV